MAASGGDSDFTRKKHIKFFKRCLQLLPGRYASLDTHRVTIVFFAISGLDLLNALEEIQDQHHAIIEWIYSMQIVPDRTDSNQDRCGFRGSTTACTDSYDNRTSASPTVNTYESGHIAMTYTALCVLLILGDDLSRVNRRGILAGLSKLQLPDGSALCASLLGSHPLLLSLKPHAFSFCPTPEGSENDMRFVYCACCISYILNDWSAVDLTSLMSYVRNSMSYCGGFGQGPSQEAHGGSTFCAIAALVLSGLSSAALSTNQTRRLIRWCVNRQQSGFQGRPNKPVDTCYSFWVGATLQLLDAYNLTDKLCNRNFLMLTQHSIAGGFAKWPDFTPDALHSYFGVCGMSLLAEPGIKPMNAALNISQSASTRLDQLHTRWHREHTQSCALCETFCQRLRECISTQSEHVVDGVERLSAVYCSLFGLDVQDSLHLLTDVDRQMTINWIYTLQSQTDEVCSFHAPIKHKGSSEQVNSSGTNGVNIDLKVTHCALRCLLLLRDDLTRVKDQAIVRLLREIGCDRQNPSICQADLVHIYLCVSISCMLQDYSAFNPDDVVSAVKQFILADGNMTKLSETEAFCVIATLSLLHALPPNTRFNPSQLKMEFNGPQNTMDSGFTSLSSALLVASINRMLKRQDNVICMENSTQSLSLHQQDAEQFSFQQSFDHVFWRALQETNPMQKICLPLLVTNRCLGADFLPELHILYASPDLD